MTMVTKQTKQQNGVAPKAQLGMHQSQVRRRRTPGWQPEILAQADKRGIPAKGCGDACISCKYAVGVDADDVRCAAPGELSFRTPVRVIGFEDGDAGGDEDESEDDGEDAGDSDDAATWRVGADTVDTLVRRDTNVTPGGDVLRGGAGVPQALIEDVRVAIGHQLWRVRNELAPLSMLGVFTAEERRELRRRDKWTTEVVQTRNYRGGARK